MVHHAVVKKFGHFAAGTKSKKAKEQKQKGSLTAKTLPLQHNETRDNRNEEPG
jgi:hypothetical protein